MASASPASRSSERARPGAEPAASMTQPARDAPHQPRRAVKREPRKRSEPLARSGHSMPSSIMDHVHHQQSRREEIRLKMK
jgi:hypothetical protein